MNKVLIFLGAALSCLVAGFLVGILAFGPLQASTTASAVIAIIGLVVWTALWSRIAQRGARWGLFALPLLVFATLTVFSLWQMYSVGAFPPLNDDRLGNFDRLWSAIRDTYPYFDIKDVDWDEVYSRYRPQIAAAPDDAAYFALIAAMLSELDDGHTVLSNPYTPFTAWFGRLEDIEGQVVLMQPTEAAAAAGLARGDVILRLNGQSVDEAVAALPPDLRNGSTPWGRRDTALSNVFGIFGAATQLDVTYINAAGETLALTLRPPEAQSSSAPGGPTITGELLESGYGYIRIPRFWEREGQDLVAEFDTALEALFDTPGIIIDLRSNGGGNSVLSDRMAGRLLASTFVYGRDVWRQRLPQRLWWGYSEYTVLPRGRQYTGHVVLLIDATTASSAEWFVVALVDGGRAQTVGRTSTGSTGNPITFLLPADGVARFSSGDFRRIDGTRVEGLGIAPDVAVTWTLDDVRAGHDPDIAAAAAWLSAQP